MEARYIQKGESIDYINGTSKLIAAGDVVVVGDHIGISGTNIPSGAAGSLHVVGVFELDKASENEITVGTNVYWGNKGITEEKETGSGENPVANVPAGFAVSGAAASEKRIQVRIG